MAANDPDLGGSQGRPAKPILIMAVFMIVAGTLLFLSNLGFLPLNHPWAFWPIVLVVIGLAKLSDSHTTGEKVWSTLMMVFGTLFLLTSVGIFHLRFNDGTWPVSILFITLGVAGLAKTLDRGRLHGRTPRTDSGAADTELLNDSVVFGNWKRRFEAAAFRGGQVRAIFGNAEIDLRGASIGGLGGAANLEIVSVFGSVKLRIPEAWRVAVRGTGYLGNFEDKTIPQSRYEANTGTLVISGYSVGSTVEIEN